MSKRTPWLYALLLLLPTLVVGGVLVRLLAHERERLARADALAAEGQARSVASELLVALNDFRSGLVRQLTDLPGAGLAAQLQAWERRDPLVRNVFILDDARGILLPDAATGLTGEEQSFLQRFEPLLSGRVTWELPPDDGTATPARPLMAQTLQRTRQSPRATEVTTGWLPWFVGRNLHLLAWVRRPADGLRYGVEVETGSLLSRLIVAFPTRLPQGRTLALLDGQGTVVHSAGAAEFRPGSPRLATVPLAPDLPHWELVAAGVVGAAPSGHLLFLLATVLCGILLVAILAAGWLLLRDARRSRTEALTKTTFVANVSHELKTPLTTIRMYAELLGEGRVPDESKRVRYLGTIVQEAGRLTRLINNVLDFSRLERGRKDYRPETLDLAAEVRRVVEAQADRWHASGLAFELAGCAAPCSIRADRDALEQALLNVLDNAAKYGAAGGRLAITVASGPRQATVRVRDWGPGIAPDHVGRLFQQFQRGDSTLTARHPGCGLGLSLSRRLLRDQGGDLDYEPAVGGGACFVLTLPRALEESDAAHDPGG